MNKKILFTVGLLIAMIFTFAVTYSFATDGTDGKTVVNDAVNGVRNVVGGAENAVEGAVNGVTETTRNTTNAADNTTNNTLNNNGATAMGTTNNTTYAANRTATTRTTANTETFLGMTSTMWTWLILAIDAVAIVALVWYYSNQISNSKKYDDNE